MIERKTQQAAYWQEQLVVTSQDQSWLYDRILDAGRPVSASELGSTLVERRCRDEETAIQNDLRKGPAYTPQSRYEVGQQILFPALGYTVGTVIGTRPGKNPEYGDFSVIRVRFEGTERVREFAADLQGDHRLNRDRGLADLVSSSALLSPAELWQQYGADVEDKLSAALSRRPEFVRFGDQWFLRELLVEVNAGQLNIAEALIEIKSMPLATADLLRDLDMPTEVPAEIQSLSLALALKADGRFSNVGTGGRDVWYLDRLTPETVTAPVPRLVIQEEAYRHSDVSAGLQAVEREIDDEGITRAIGPSRPTFRAVVTLIYPHWRMGTLPLTPRTEGLFPQPTDCHAPVVLVDAQSGEQMQGWVVRDRGYVYGLEDWYKRYQLPAGAYVKLERTRDPRVITVDYDVQRLKRLWVKVATVKDGQLVFQLRKLPVSCGFDEHMIVTEDNPVAIDKLWAETERSGDGLFDIMIRLMPELVKLSPQGAVHAKTIYSTVNILRRTAPGPVFALLSTEPCFVSMEGGYWTFDPAAV